MNQDLNLRSMQKRKRAINALYFPSSSKDAADSKSSNIAFVDAEKFHSICQAKNMQTWIVKWLDLLDSGDNKTASLMVGAVIEENLGPSQMVLPKKYSDFSDVFDKTRVDVLSQHSQHDQAIELEADKQPLFGLIYDFSRTEFNVLC